MNSKRPINLALHTLTFPPMAIASILHRMTGIVIFLLLPFVMYVFQLSLGGVDDVNRLQTWFSCSFVRLGIWVFGTAMIYHVIAGVRHLLCDLGWGETLPLARWTAYIIVGLSGLGSIFLGILLW